MDFERFLSNYQVEPVTEIENKVPQNPVVSVCVQTYQHEKYIQKCLDGILKQKTDFPFEILIGEDASNDDTRQICLAYATSNPEKIRLFLHHRENVIKVFGRSTGNFNSFYNLFSARGKYIAFCEGDDFWTDPEKLQKQVDFLENNKNFSFSFHSYEPVNSTGLPVTDNLEIIQPQIDISVQELWEGRHHPLILTICCRNNFRELPEEIFEIINVDTFFLSLLANYGKGKFQHTVLPSAYRQHAHGIWSKRKKELKFVSKIRTFEKIKMYYYRNGHIDLSRHYHQKKENVAKMLFFFYLKRGKLKAAFNLMRGTPGLFGQNTFFIK